MLCGGQWVVEVHVEGELLRLAAHVLHLYRQIDLASVQRPKRGQETGGAHVQKAAESVLRDVLAHLEDASYSLLRGIEDRIRGFEGRGRRRLRAEERRDSRVGVDGEGLGAGHYSCQHSLRNLQGPGRSTERGVEAGD